MKDMTEWIKTKRAEAARAARSFLNSSTLNDILGLRKEFGKLEMLAELEEELKEP
jgi:hypothetical protein